MREFELPALEYCSLSRATRFIGGGCEVEDLLHWAEIGAINLSYKFDSKDESGKFSAFIEFDGTASELAKKIFNSKQYNDYHINISKHSIIATTDFEECESVDDIEAILMQRGDKPNIRAYLKGVWDIKTFITDNRLTSPYRRLVFCPMDNNSIMATASVNEDIGIAECELLISKAAIMKVLGRVEPMREIPVDETHVFSVYSEEKQSKEDTSKTIARNRAAMIKALLAIHYGEDVANNPRKFIENTRSEICKDFQLKGIKLPSGKIISDWLKDADIDIG